MVRPPRRLPGDAQTLRAACIAMTMTARLALGGIRLYQLMLSPMTGGACRFVPSCSVYAADAVRTHGALRGGFLALRRLARCHPLGGSGLDPVPPRCSERPASSN